MTTPCLPEALDALRPDLLRIARHLTGSADQAQDLCQDVLLSLWIRICDDEDIDNLRAYAMTSLRNRYRQILRRRVTKTELAEDMLIEQPQAFAQLALHELDDAITRLPREQARLIRMVAAGETSPVDLARLTGWPKNTVMSRLARARAQLRGEMGLKAHTPVSALI
ncbi:RNA polymerase sigma factor [Roseovarius sp. 2305UL8-3]|uniref:RNA polymerase sigma factor n=1 Tax=Roseovarius conchicola TaxID=3121636 RepID=UPI0035288382